MPRNCVFVLTLVLLTCCSIFATKHGDGGHHMLQKPYKMQDVAFRLKINIKTKTCKTSKTLGSWSPRNLEKHYVFQGVSLILLFFQPVFGVRLDEVEGPKVLQKTK